MATKALSVEQFIAYMRKRQGDQSDKDFARWLGVSPQHLCDIYHVPPRRSPGETIAKALGAERKTVFILGGKD